MEAEHTLENKEPSWHKGQPPVHKGQGAPSEQIKIATKRHSADKQPYKAGAKEAVHCTSDAPKALSKGYAYKQVDKQLQGRKPKV